jgi:hypothetical protein
MRYKKFKDLLIVSIIFLLCLYLYKDIIFFKNRIFSFVESDIFCHNFSFDYLTFGYQGNRHISLWNPYIFLGEPLISHPTHALFYPLNLLFFLLPLHLALNYSLFINTLLSGIVIYLYVRYLGKDRFSALAAAVIFMFNAVIMLHAYAGHLPVLETLPWLVLLFLLSEICMRKNQLKPAILAGLVLGIQFLVGNAQYTFYTIIAVTAYFLFSIFRDYSKDKNSQRFAFLAFSYLVIIFIGLGTAAIKLIPSLEFVRLSDRSANDLAFVSSWSFPPENLLTYLLPEFYGDMIHFPYWGQYGLWEMCGYVGILPLILSVIAIIYQRNRYTVFFGCLSAFALLGALGIHTPLFKIFYHFLPGFNKFRGHSKMIILFAFSVSVLSAYGLSWILAKKDREGQRKFRRILWPLGVIAALAIFFAILFNLNNRIALEWWMRLWKNNNWPLNFIRGSLNCALFSLRKFSLFSAASFLLLFFWMNRRLPLKAFKFFIFVLILADLWLFGSKYIVTNNVEVCYWDRKIVSFLKDKGAPYTYRVMSPQENGPFPNKALLDGIHMVDGYDAIFLQRFLDLFVLCSLEPIDSGHNLKLLSMANLKFLVMPKNVKLNNPGLSLAYETGDVKVWQNSKCLPRAYIVHGVKIIGDGKERISNILFDKDFDALSTVILEEDAALNTGIQSLGQQPDEAVEFLKYSNDEVMLQAVLKQDGYLVLSDYNYPGWRVDILNLSTGEHKQVNPLYANHVFRAVGLKGGRYSLRFIFKPQSFYRGCQITVVTIAIVILSLILLKLRKRN